MLFNYRTSRKIPIIGKHQRAIVTGAFDSDLFAVGSEDMSVTVNNLDGEIIATMSCNPEPSNLHLTRFRRLDSHTDELEVFVSFVVGRRTLSVAPINDTDNPVSLQFQDRYGLVVDTQWYNQGMICVAFEKGFFVILSAQNWSEVNHELFSVQEFHSTITNICVSSQANKLFTAGDNGQ
jgi:hypothetical protein